MGLEKRLSFKNNIFKCRYFKTIIVLIPFLSLFTGCAVPINLTSESLNANITINDKRNNELNTDIVNANRNNRKIPGLKKY